MNQLVELTSVDQWKDLYQSGQAILLLKHSTTCPISAEAHKQFESFRESYQGNGLTFCIVKVIEERPVSNQIAEDVQIKHESPQCFYISNQQVSWSASHWSITRKAIEAAL